MAEPICVICIYFDFVPSRINLKHYVHGSNIIGLLAKRLHRKHAIDTVLCRFDVLLYDVSHELFCLLRIEVDLARLCCFVFTIIYCHVWSRRAYGTSTVIVKHPGVSTRTYQMYFIGCGCPECQCACGLSLLVLYEQSIWLKCFPVFMKHRNDVYTSSTKLH